MNLKETHTSLVFLKLGGSLITDKEKPRTPRLNLIKRISKEIAEFIKENPHYSLLLGHGSGSFGHYSGKKHGTWDGVTTTQNWLGFVEVWQDASTLHRIIMDELHSAGIPAIAFPPSAMVVSQNRKITTWNIEPIQSALKNGLIPVTYGDVVFDINLGGTIQSTEDLFIYLAHHLRPARILLAGQDPGVWKDFPKCTSIYQELSPSDIPELQEKIHQSNAPDVTGGMEDKVNQMLALVNHLPDLQVEIFSGQDPGAILSSLRGENRGTILCSK